MIAEIAAACSTVKNLHDLLKATKEPGNADKISAVVGELNSQLIEVQMAFIKANETHSNTLQIVDSLNQEVVRLKNWQIETERYQLSEIASGIFVYSVKPDMKNNEPLHHLCAKCYNNSQKSILQRSKKTDGWFLDCHNCGSSCGPSLRFMPPANPTASSL